MPSQPSDNEPVSVDDWYHTKNSAPTTTEVLLCTLLIQLVVGNGREGFMGAVEAEMAPNFKLLNAKIFIMCPLEESAKKKYLVISHIIIFFVVKKSRTVNT